MSQSGAELRQQENRIVGPLLELSHDRHTKYGFLVTVISQQYPKRKGNRTSTIPSDTRKRIQLVSGKTKYHDI